MTYDLAILGDGIFGKLFLYELNSRVKKSQNFSVAQISSDKLAPACSLRTTSTVSLNGIEEGVSELGNELRHGFLAFKEFYKKNRPDGIFPTEQIIVVDDQNENNIIKIKRRYSDQWSNISDIILKKNLIGIKLNSYIVSPELFFKHIKIENPNYQLNHFDSLAFNISKNDQVYEIVLSNNEKVKAKKVIICTGAYSRIHTSLFRETLFADKINLTKVVAGSYLKKTFNYPHNVYITINGHNVVYRKETKELIIGSTTVQGPILAPDLSSLREIFSDVQINIDIDLGKFNDYEVVTGLRHKGQKRMPFFKAITDDQNVWFFNGAYKNGWSLPFHYINQNIDKIIN